MDQLSVFIEDRVGSALRVTNILSEININIHAFSMYDTPEFNILRLVVDDAQKAQKKLEQAEILVRISNVIGVELNDTPGELTRILQILADHNMVVNYMYSLVLRGESKPLMVFSLEDNEKARDLLKKNGIKLAD